MRVCTRVLHPVASSCPFFKPLRILRKSVREFRVHFEIDSKFFDRFNVKSSIINVVKDSPSEFKIKKKKTRILY